jgi:hypothetical protein
VNEPIYQAWRTIAPVEGEPIPNGAEFSQGWVWFSPDAERYPEFVKEDMSIKWRVPVPVIPEDVAVELIEQLCQRSFNDVFDWPKTFASVTPDQFAAMVVAKLRELSKGKSCN